MKTNVLIVFNPSGNFETKSGEPVLLQEIPSDTEIASKKAIVVEGSTVDKVAEKFQLTSIN